MVAEDVVALQLKLVEEFYSSPDLFEEIARVEGLLAETYRDRFLYELLQNSDDAGSRSVKAKFERDSFTWENDGRSMTAADVESLCRSARSTKRMHDGSIGYRGIGFKSLAAIAREIWVESSDVRFAFSRERSSSLVGASSATMPLIRIPNDVLQVEYQRGTLFTVDLGAVVAGSTVAVDPLAMLFLRNVESLAVEDPAGRITVVRKRRTEVMTELEIDKGAVAEFSIRELGDDAHIAIPLNPRALSLAGVGGRLCCFLPLEDSLGLPCIVSGKIMTDPSRKHAAIEDPATMRVIRAAAECVFDVLRNSSDPLFERMWELCVMAEDPRVVLSSNRTSAPSVLWSTLRELALSVQLDAKYSAVTFQADEVDLVIPPMSPRALFLNSNSSGSKALRSVLRIESVDIGQIVSAEMCVHLSSETSQALESHLLGHASAFGRALTTQEHALVERLKQQRVVQKSATDTANPIGTDSHVIGQEPREGVDVGRRSRALESYLQSWRAAEKSVENYLNDLGWSVTDVSLQNLGYDLSGEDSDGKPVFVEVKRVDGPNSRFAITSNEMSFLQSNSKAFVFAIVMGQGRGAELYLIRDRDGVVLPFERVCRRWDWECSDWISSGRRV